MEYNVDTYGNCDKARWGRTTKLLLQKEEEGAPPSLHTVNTTQRQSELDTQHDCSPKIKYLHLSLLHTQLAKYFEIPGAENFPDAVCGNKTLLSIH